MPASTEEVVEANEDGVHISCGWGPVEVRTGENGRVSEVVFKRCLRVFNDEGRFDPQYDESETANRRRRPRRVLHRSVDRVGRPARGRGRRARSRPGRRRRPQDRTRPHSPTSSWAATSTPAPSSPSTPSPPATRPRCPFIASCRMRRSPSAATRALTAS
ncbi:MAG: hypothetical protein ACLTSX_10450 [Collinsella sp.]